MIVEWHALADDAWPGEEHGVNANFQLDGEHVRMHLHCVYRFGQVVDENYAVPGEPSAVKTF